MVEENPVPPAMGPACVTYVATVPAAVQDDSAILHQGRTVRVVPGARRSALCDARDRHIRDDAPTVRGGSTCSATWPTLSTADDLPPSGQARPGLGSRRYRSASEFAPTIDDVLRVEAGKLIRFDQVDVRCRDRVVGVSDRSTHRLGVFAPPEAGT